MIRAAAFAFARISTDEVNGAVGAYVGEGIITDDVYDHETYWSAGETGIPETLPPGRRRLERCR